MESIRLSIPLTLAHGAGSFVRVYTDGGSGTLDLDAPISGRVPCRPKAAADPSHLVSRHLCGRHLVGVGENGHLQGLHLLGEHLLSQDFVAWVGGQFYGPKTTRGLHAFGSRIFDRDGRAAATTPPSTDRAINSSPRGVRALEIDSYAGGSLTLTFTPSIDL